MKPVTSAFLTVLALAGFGFGQAKPTVVGWADQGPRTTSELHVQDVLSKCPKATLLCQTQLQSTQGFSGGTAYDPQRHAVFASDGRQLELTDVATCKVLCSSPAQLMSSGATVSGLAMIDGGRRLLQLETSLGYAGLRSYDARACPPTPLRDGCTLQVPTGAYCGGLAVDETRGLVYVSVTLPAVISARNFIRVLKASDKCRMVCEVEIPICGPPLIDSQVLGLAFDGENDRLFATFGHYTWSLKLADPSNCKLEAESCCDKQLPGRWRGLAVVPGASVSHYGKACIGKGCPFCSNLGARTVGGMPVIGNQDFGFLVENAPAPSFGLLILGFGRCTKGIGVPFLCGAIYPSLSPPTVFLGPLVIQGKGQCQGSAVAPLPLPADARFSGVTLCLEWLVVCGQVSGFGLSDAYEVRIG